MLLRRLDCKRVELSKLSGSWKLPIGGYAPIGGSPPTTGVYNFHLIVQGTSDVETAVSDTLPGLPEDAWLCILSNLARGLKGGIVLRHFAWINKFFAAQARGHPDNVNTSAEGSTTRPASPLPNSMVATSSSSPAHPDPSPALGKMKRSELDKIPYGKAASFLARRGGDPHDVAANGTCWLYAVMGALHVLDAQRLCSPYVATNATKITPSKKDVGLSEVFLAAMKREFLSFPAPKARETSRKEDFAEVARQLETMRVWNFDLGDEMAPFGGDKQLFLLARVLERHIVVLHGETMAGIRDSANRNLKDLNRTPKTHRKFAKESESIVPREVGLVSVLLLIEEFPDTLVIEIHDSNHYHALVRRTREGTLPAFLQKALREYAQ